MENSRPRMKEENIEIREYHPRIKKEEFDQEIEGVEFRSAIHDRWLENHVDGKMWYTYVCVVIWINYLGISVKFISENDPKYLNSGDILTV